MKCSYESLVKTANDLQSGKITLQSMQQVNEKSERFQELVNISGQLGILQLREDCTELLQQRKKEESMVLQFVEKIKKFLHFCKVTQTLLAKGIITEVNKSLFLILISRFQVYFALRYS